MTLEKINETIDFVQNTTPSSAKDGETWLDTSLSPPQLKVFDDAAGAFVSPRSVQNLDAPVSEAGATQSDIETAVDNSTTASTISSNLDAKVSNAGKTATATDKNSTSEIATGVDDSNTASTVSTNLDAKVSNAGKTATATDKNSTSEIATGVDNSSTASTVSTNLDAKVSNAGKTATATDKNSTSEIATGVDNSSTASTISSNLDAKVSNIGGGVDWSSKTPKAARFRGNVSTSNQTNGQGVSVTGSGYITSVKNVFTSDQQADYYISVDGTDVRSINTDASFGALETFDKTTAQFTGNETTAYLIEFDSIARFESSFEVAIRSEFGNQTDIDFIAEVDYVLD